MKKKYYIFFLLILLFSCSREKEIKINIFPWNFNENKSIHDIIDSIEFIALEAHPEGIFNRADKLIVFRDKFFVFDMEGQNQVFVFDNVGNFLYKVGKRGAGPGEYIGIRNFTIDENFIYVVDNYISKMFKYSIFDGTYLESKNIPFIIHDMAIAENGDFIVTRQRIEGENIPPKYAYHIMITDDDFNVKSKFFPFQKEDCEIWSQYYYFQYVDKHIAFHTMIGDSVVLLNRYNPSDSSYVVYKMDFGKNKAPHKIQNDRELIKKYRFLSSTPEIMSKYIAGKYWHDEEVGSDPYIYDTEKQTVYVNNYDIEYVNKFFFSPLFHVGDTLYSLYDKSYYYLWQNSNVTPLLPVHIKKHLDEGDDVLIKYILK
jgi:hypothetical protein